MRVTVKYGNRWFGNDSDMPDYKLSVETAKPRFSDPSVRLNFSFLKPAGGRGVGYNRGYVSGATIGLSAEQARRLAVTLLWAIEQESPTSLVLAFGKAAQEA